MNADLLKLYNWAKDHQDLEGNISFAELEEFLNTLK